MENPTATSTALSTIKGANPIKWIQWVIFGLFIFFAFKLLRKFNLLGESDESKEARLLGEDPALAQPLSDLNNPKNIFTKAIIKKFGKKPTKAQMDSLLPNKAKMPKLMTQILDSKNVIMPNNAAKIFGAIRLLYSQYEINFFSTVMSLVIKEDFYGKLDKLMSDDDMGTLRKIINSKPLI